MCRDGKNKAVALATAGATAGRAGPAVKEKIFSIIKKASEEGITDGRHTLWIGFAPHIAVVEKEDGYVVWLWRDALVVKLLLDREFNVLGFDVEVR
ncbi:MAG: hypothetical protein ACO2PN_27815 [Pyrobaculum sp.]|jgi:predicted RecA/RadA family phage recombinase